MSDLGTSVQPGFLANQGPREKSMHNIDENHLKLGRIHCTSDSAAKLTRALPDRINFCPKGVQRIPGVRS
jgi:hypothetical protein